MNRGETYKFTKICPICSVEFRAKRKRRLYCSAACTSHRHSLKYKNRHIVLPELLQTKGVKPRRGVVRACAYCSKEIYIVPSRAKSTKTNYCSKEHLMRSLRENGRRPLFVPCRICATLIRTCPSTQKHRPRVTCSRFCQNTLIRLRALDRRKNYTKHQIDRLARYSPEATEWRKQVFARDNYTCTACQTRGSYLEADHIKPWAYFPELRFELSNGRTLCRACHNKTKVGAKKMRQMYAIAPHLSYEVDENEGRGNI